MTLRPLLHWLFPSLAFAPSAGRLFSTPDVHVITRAEGTYICAGPMQILIHSPTGDLRRIQRQDLLDLTPAAEEHTVAAIGASFDRLADALREAA